MARVLTISVVTPSFNQAQYLRSTMLSVLGQNYPNIEYIVIDGGSSDASIDIIQEYAPRLAYWCSEPDRGQADAIRKGFGRSTGDILCWLNSDDILLPGALRAVAQCFANRPAVEAISGGAFFVDQDGRPMHRLYGSYSLGLPSTYRRFRVFGQDGVFQQATFWRRSAYEAVGGIDTSLEFIMDLDLFTRLAARRRFGWLPRLLAAFRLHSACKSLTIDHVRQRELSDYRNRYEVPPAFLSEQSQYEFYRCAHRLRKAFLASLALSRLVRLPSLV